MLFRILGLHPGACLRTGHQCCFCISFSVRSCIEMEPLNGFMYLFILLSSSGLRILGPSKQFLPVYHPCPLHARGHPHNGRFSDNSCSSVLDVSPATQLFPTFPTCLSQHTNFLFLHSPKIRTECFKEQRNSRKSRKNDLERTVNKCYFSLPPPL